MGKTIYQLLVITVLFACNMIVHASQQPQAFSSGSYTKIVERYHNQPFILVLWSLDCSSCYRELEMLGKLVSQQGQSINIVLVSIDIDASAEELNAVLERYQLQNRDNWVFADENVQRLRYEIDRQWYGELPRSYLFDESHQRISVSGVLSDVLLENWRAKR